MRQTAKILKKLLTDGELGAPDSALIADFRTPEVREELDEWGEELGFSLLDIRGKVYLIPNADSDLLSFSIRDVRESDSRADRMIDAFLQCYVTMAILWMIYGGKNANPKRAVFLQTKDIVAELDGRFSDAAPQEGRFSDTSPQEGRFSGAAPQEGRFSGAASAQALQLENEYEINFSQIAAQWTALPVYDEQRRKTRIGAVLRSCRLLEREKLLLVLDEGREIRPTERLDDLMIGYYLDMRRVDEINRLFDGAPGAAAAGTDA